MSNRPIICFVLPTLRPCGGVIKMFDYMMYASKVGFQLRLHCAKGVCSKEKIFDIEKFSALQEKIEVVNLKKEKIPKESIVVFSFPENYELILNALPADYNFDRLIHLVQNVRHANLSFLAGDARRILSKYLTRVYINKIVEEAVVPHVNPNSLSMTNNIGHDAEYFYKQRQGALGCPVKVAYMTWKSSLGLEVEKMLKGRKFIFKKITRAANWKQLKKLYHWADVLLGFTDEEEGMYLPGLEAMAAGLVVIVPNAKGNMAYCRFGENCLEAKYENAASYIELLERIESGEVNVAALRQAGYHEIEKFSLSSEALKFSELLMQLSQGR